MSTPPQKKRFTSELRRLQEMAHATGGGEDNGSADLRHTELMRAIEELRRDFAAVSDVSGSVIDVDAYRREVHEAEKLKAELQTLSDAIDETKREIAALHPSRDENDRLLAVTHELDAVVGATEHATDTILAAAETIESLASSLRVHATGDDDVGALEEIAEQTVAIFEACNFQDITGQRITKVVNTLKFIEERIQNMMDIWGGKRSFKHVTVPDEVAQQQKDGDARLLNGPQLDAHRISQDDIDKLFD